MENTTVRKRGRPRSTSVMVKKETLNDTNTCKKLTANNAAVPHKTTRKSKDKEQKKSNIEARDQLDDLEAEIEIEKSKLEQKLQNESVEALKAANVELNELIGQYLEKLETNKEKLVNVESELELLQEQNKILVANVENYKFLYEQSSSSSQQSVVGCSLEKTMADEIREQEIDDLKRNNSIMMEQEKVYVEEILSLEQKLSAAKQSETDLQVDVEKVKLKLEVKKIESANLESLVNELKARNATLEADHSSILSGKTCIRLN
ncbi:hypothetical protein DdX_20116 [Ditylenchus destructor]|uniref:Uncharacterized protein n=1 Tax=Ditylenchus destructor TaxID=166010 RepID=A0AAD4MHQ5_9BILA|nr:hypothetical protein DdX_20116 [Ditylenchus destructor]